MDRWQCKDTFNNTKNSVPPPETSDSPTVRTEHPDADEMEENYLKNNFMKMIKTLKEKMKNFLKK